MAVQEYVKGEDFKKLVDDKLINEFVKECMEQGFIFSSMCYKFSIVLCL